MIFNLILIYFMNKGLSTELFLPTLKSNIKSDPAFFNVYYIIIVLFRIQIL